MDPWALQAEICRKHGTPWDPTDPEQIVGLARNVGTGLQPVNGLRHPPKDGTSGWYIWAGEELSQTSDFFEPTHATHLATRSPEVIQYLGLGPGWRFLLAPGQVDVWYDPTLLKV